MGRFSATVVLVAPAVPARVTSPVAKPVTGSVKTTVKLIGLLLVGSAWPLAWLMVTAGGVVSGGLAVNVTVLSVLVEAALGLPAPSVATPAAMDATTVPLPVMPADGDVVGGAVVGGAFRHRGAGGASRAGQGHVAGGEARHGLGEPL